MNAADIAIDSRTPLDELEPLENPNPIHEARLRAVEMINRFASELEQDIRHCPLAFQRKFWGIAYGLGLGPCAGVNMYERARQLGCSRAALSHHANRFCLANDLMPSLYMRSPSARGHSFDARLRVLRGQSGK
jgi:hypothetical protein